MSDLADIFRMHRICVIVPTYNNAGTIADVLHRIESITQQIIVVNDGSTDDTKAILDADFASLSRVEYAENKGKGYALRRGLRYAREQGYAYAITIDSDGQHFPEDIPLIVQKHEQNPDAIVVGARCLNEKNMPSGNTFANKFSNFWFKLQTSIDLPDTQSGFRLYPLNHLSGERFLTARYEAELALLVFSAWAGTPIVSTPVRVYYPPQEARVTHFRPFADFARISLLNGALCFLAVVYGYPRMLLRKLCKK